MFRVVFLFLFFFLISLQGEILQEKIKNIIGERNYLIHKGLIGHLFKNEPRYFNGDRIRYFNLFKTLQENGLLDLRLQKRGNIQLKFKISNNQQKGYKILNDTLETLGYKYFFTTVFENNVEYILWDISFSAEYNVDPVIFIRELKQNGVQVMNVTKIDEKSWSYELDFHNAYLERSVKIDTNEKVYFRKLLKPLVLNVPEIKSVEVRSHNLNRWYPKVVFFDKNLKVLKSIEYAKYQKRIKVSAPLGTKYVKVTDLYNLINIKRGLTIIVR